MELRIRTATIDDLPAIFHLGERLFTARDHANLYRSWDEYEVTNLFTVETDRMIVAEADGEIVGFAMGSVFEKARSAWNYGHLLWLGVDPDHAGQGIASRLVDEFEERMRAAGVRILLVDTQADNDEALALFRKKGFDNPIDHVYLALNLETRERNGDE